MARYIIFFLVIISLGVKAQRPVFTDEQLKELAKLPVYTFEEKIKLIGMTFTALEQYNVIKTDADGKTYGGRGYTIVIMNPAL